MTGDSIKLEEDESVSVSASYTATFKRTDQLSFSGTIYLHNKTQKIYKTISNNGTVQLPVNKGDWVYFGISYSSYSTRSMWLYVSGFITSTYARYYGWNEMYFQWDVARSDSLTIGTWTDSWTMPYLVTYDANGGSLEAANTSTTKGALACWFENDSLSVNRKYRKESTEKSLLGWGQINGGWMGIINVGKTAESVRSYTESYDYHFGGSEYGIDGEKWHVAVVGPGYQGYLDRKSPSASERVGTFIPLWKEFSNSVDTDFAFDSTWSPSIESARQLLEFHKNYCYVFNLSGSIRFPSVNPTREGYAFKGWYTAKSGGTKVTSTRALSGNVTYYAQWTPNTYSVTFNPGIGTTSVLEDYGNGNTDALLSVLGGRGYYKRYAEPAIVGVTKNPSNAVAPIMISTNAKSVEYICDACPTNGAGQHRAESNTLYFDQLRGKYYLYLNGTYYSYNKSAGTFVAENPFAINAQTLVKLYVAGLTDSHAMGNATDQSGKGYFYYAYTTSKLTGSDGAWFRPAMALAFLENVLGATTKKTVTFGSAYGTLPEAYAFGHVFAGWWTKDGTNGDWGVQVKSTDLYSTFGTQNLYARYTPNTYTLEYNANGGQMEREFAFNDMKRFDDAGSIIMLMRDANTQNPRFFYKTYAGESYVAMLVRNGTVAQDGEVWGSPIMFAKDTDALGYHVSSTLTWNWENADSSGKGSVEIDGETWYYLGAELAYTSAISHFGYINDMNSEITTRLFGEDIHDAVANFVAGKTANYQFGKTKALSSPKTRKGYQFEGWWTKDGTSSGDWGTQITSQTQLYWLGGEIVNVYNNVYYTQAGTCTYKYSKIEPLTLYAKWSVKSTEAVRFAVGLSGIGPSEGLVDESYMWAGHYEYDYAYEDIVGFITPYDGLIEVDYERILTNVTCDFGVSLNGIFANSGYRFAGVNVSTSGYDWSLPSVESWKSADSCVSFVPELSGATYYVSLVFEETDGKLLYSHGIEHYFEENDHMPQLQNNGLWKFQEGTYGTATLKFYAEKSGDIVLEVTEAFSDSGASTWLEFYLNGYWIIGTSIDDETAEFKIENVAAGWNEIFISMDTYSDLLVRFSDESEVGSGYFYFEDGVYPQDYVGSYLNGYYESDWTTGGGSATYILELAGQECPVIPDGGVYVARVVAPKTFTTTLDGESVTFTEGQGYWFRLDPIRWRVTPLGVKVDEVPEKFAEAGWKNETFQVVSDKVLDFGRVNADGVVGSGWSYTDSDMFEAINANFSALRGTFKHAEEAEWRIDSISKSGESDGITTGTNQKVVSTYNNSHTGLLQASVQDVDKLYQDNYSEIFARDAYYYHNNTKLDESKRSAYASDLVVMLSGKAISRFAEYGTRDLYNNKNNFNIASSGYKKNVWLNGSSGVRFSYAYRQNQEKAKLLSGKEFNAKIKTLVAGTAVAYDKADTTLTKIVFDYLDENGEYILDSFNITSGIVVDVSENQDGSILACWNDGGYVDGEVIFVLSSANVFANEDASYMFYGLQSVTEIVFDNFSTVNVTNMQDMFAGCYVLENFDVSGFDTSNVTNLNGVFKNCRALAALEVSNWDVRKVTTMKSVFDNCFALTNLNLSGWDVTNKLKDMKAMFNDCNNLTTLDLTDWDTSEVENMESLFGGCKLLSNIEGFSSLNVEKVKYMGGMFLGCSALIRLDLSKWKTSALTSVTIYDTGRASWDGMFRGCSALQEIKFGEGFKVDKVTSLCNLFFGCSSLKSLNIKNWNVSNVTSFSQLFSGCNSLASLDLTGWNTSSSTSMGGMFQYCYSLTEIKGIEGFVTSNVTGMGYMFNQCSSLTSLDVSNFDTSRVTDMNGLFHRCYGLKTLDVSNFNTSKVRSMQDMFINCQNLTSLDVSHFDMSGVTNVYGMFQNCYKLKTINMFEAAALTDMKQMFMNCQSLTTIDLSGVFTSNVTNMSNMFYNCYDLQELDVSHFDTSNVTDMSGMFYNCDELRTLNLSNFDTSNVTSMASMFYWCDKLYHIDLSGWDTSNVENMYGMFESSPVDELDLSSFDTSKVKNMTYMFLECHNLKTIYVSDLWTLENVESATNIFGDCMNLVGGNGTAYANVGNNGSGYARIDTAAKPGYFTRKAVVVDCQELRDVLLDYSIREITIGLDPLPGFSTYETFGPNGEVRLCGEGFVFYLTSNHEIWLSGDATELFSLPSFREFAYCAVSFGNVNTSLVTNMSGMFRYDGVNDNFDIYGVEELETSNVTDMSFMFAGADVSNSVFENFDTSKVTNMKGMFANSQLNDVHDLSSFDTSNVTDMSQMFVNAKDLISLDLTNFDISNVEDMSSMFEMCVDLRSIFVGDKWTMENVDISLDMFDSCWALYGDFGTSFDSVYDGGTYARIDGGTANPGYLSSKNRGSMLIGGQAFRRVYTGYDNYGFVDEQSLVFDYYDSYNSYKYAYNGVTAEVVKGAGVDVSLAQDGSIKLYRAYINGGNFTFVLSYCKIFANVDSSYMFSGYVMIVNDEPFVFNNFDTSLVEDMSYMFYNNPYLYEFDLSNFDTSSVKNIESMFRDCDSVETIYVSEWWQLDNDWFDINPSNDVFMNCYILVGGSGLTYDSADSNWYYARIDGGSRYGYGYFTYKPHK